MIEALGFIQYPILVTLHISNENAKCKTLKIIKENSVSRIRSMSKGNKLKFYIGIDNGVTGSIGIVGRDLTYYNMVKTPVISGQDYTKAKRKTSLDVDVKVLAEIIVDLKEYAPCVAIGGRPMKNPARFEATCSAMRALEETELDCIRALSSAVHFVDSKEWQREL